MDRHHLLLSTPGAAGYSPQYIVASGVPSGGTGNNGDMYINSATDDIYGPKVAGSWGSIVCNIKGATGATGSNASAANWRGAYVGGTTYAQGDGVTDVGISYISLQAANTGHTPASSPTWWQSAAGSGGVADPGANGVMKRTALNTTAAALADDLSSPVYAADSGAANALVATLAPAITAYATGTRYRVKAANANTTATTININALGSKTIKKWAGGSLVDLSSGDIAAGQMLELTYDGTYMQVLSITTTETWTAVTFSNSWSNLGSGYQTAAYIRIPLMNGGYLVKLRGMIVPGTTTDGTAMFTLPVGFRPTATETFIAVTNNTAGSTCRVDVSTGGSVAIYGYGSGAFVSINGISFLTF